MNKKLEYMIICKKDNVELHVYHNYNVDINLFYGNDHVVDIDKDAADYAILNNAKRNDIVATDDYGLACMCIGKGCFVLNKKGVYINNHNLETFLASRYAFQEARRQAQRKGRTMKNKNNINLIKEKNFNYEHSLKNLISKAKGVENDNNRTLENTKNHE